MAKCKITVLKKMFNPDLAEEYRRADVHYGPCPYYEDGDEFVIGHMGERPEGFFCDWAWDDCIKFYSQCNWEEISVRVVRTG
jgi:uncharacterized repeat protein (TIGR04076 family)